MHWCENTSQSAYLTTFVLAVIVTLDLLTSKSNQFIFVPNCTGVVNWWNSVKQFVRHCVNKLLVWSLIIHTQVHRQPNACGIILMVVPEAFCLWAVHACYTMLDSQTSAHMTLTGVGWLFNTSRCSPRRILLSTSEINASKNFENSSSYPIFSYRELFW